jgi:SAM-dependent methyltransferase
MTRPGIDQLLQDLLGIVTQGAPHLLRLFETFAQEARFAREWLAPGLARIRRGDPGLEVGAGLMLPSCQLTREGYAVTSLEPIGDGFSHFSELQALVLQYAKSRGIEPEIVRIPVEELAAEGRFAFAFSVNVMEHVGSVPTAIRNVGRALRPGGEYRFICPNYLFPYEPHFDIPTLLSKRLTARVFAARISRSDKVVDPEGVWRSLNWITVSAVEQAARLVPGMDVKFDRNMFRIVLLRAIKDAEFSARRAGWVRILVRGFVFLGLHRLVGYLPPHVHPMIDCTMTRSDAR